MQAQNTQAKMSFAIYRRKFKCILHEVDSDFEERWQNIITVTTNKFFRVVFTCLTHS
jgi:hypothetical protein